MRTTPLDVISVHYAARSALAAMLIVAVVVVVVVPAAVTVTGGARKYAMQFFQRHVPLQKRQQTKRAERACVRV